MGSNVLSPNLEGHEGSHCKDSSNLEISDTGHRKDIGWYAVFADMDGNSDDSMTPTGDSPALAVSLPSPHDISGSSAGKESYKAQRKNYRKEKKRVYRELLTTLQDKSIIILSDWLKVRGTLKGWTKLWCVLKPGMLILYKSEKTKSSHWVGTVLLNSCELIERPSKKNGFCFKIFHPLEQSIWATRGPENEAMRAVVQPLPTSSLIFRAPSQTAGKCWMDALELALRCSSLLKRSMSQRPPSNSTPKDPVQRYSSAGASASLNESDAENHFFDHDLDDNTSHTGRETGTLADEEDHASLSDHDPDSESDDGFEEENHNDDEPTNGGHLQQTEYSIHVEEDFDFGNVGSQTEELGEENKSLLWFLLKQVRPGMDLSKVVLPTFILEPRSFLDKLSDYYYHSDILSTAALCDDPLLRMCNIVKWYLSGFYKKPKGLKKPYNPILGETYRCYWLHPNNSRTFYIAEQVSHHPPLSAFYVSNRQDGFNITGSILAKSKFYGNSTSAIFDGEARLTLLPRGESYIITMPYAHAKGILMGTISMELGGKVSINCDKTGYSTEIDFKLKPLIGGSGQINAVVGKIKLGKEVLYSIEGRWDSDIYITDKKTEIKETLWKPTLEVKNARLQKYTVPLDKQGSWESEKLWIKVSHAIASGDQMVATEEKTVLEERQRTAAKERKASHLEWSPAYFHKDALTNEWLYKYADWRPWDQHNDVFEYEKDYVIKTLTRHRAPMIRTASLMSKDKALVVESLPARLSRSSNDKFRSNLFRRSPTRVSDSSTPDGHDDLFGLGEGDATQVDGCLPRQSLLTSVMETMNRQNYEISNRLMTIERQLSVIGGRLSVRQSENADDSNLLLRTLSSGSLLHVLLVLTVAFAMQWFLQYVDHRRHSGGR